MAAGEVSVIDITIKTTDKTDAGLSSASKALLRFERTIQKTQQALEKIQKMSKKELALYAVDKASKIIDSVFKAGKKLAGKTWKVTITAVDKLTAPFRGMLKMLSNPIVALAGVAGIGLGVKDTIDTFKNFEQAMANVKAITGSTESEFKQLTDTAKELGQTTSFSATQAAEGMTYLGMAGWNSSQIVSAMPGLLDLAAAGSTELATAADIVSDVMTAFGLEAKTAGHTADVFAKAVTSSNMTIEMLGETMKYAAPIAKSFGMSLEETTAIAGMMANAGIKASQSGTSIRSALLRMADPRKRAEMMLDKMNMSFVDTAGNMKSITTIVREMNKAFSKLGGPQSAARMEAAQRIFGIEAASGWLAVLDQGETALESFIESLENSDGAARKMADIKLDTLAGSFNLLAAAAEDLKIGIGERLAPHLRTFAEWLTDKMPEIKESAINAFGAIETKIRELIATVRSFTSGEQWQQADGIWEKIGLAWDEFIVKPFDEWWSTTGKAWLCRKAEEIGEGIGSAISTSVKTLFNIDVDEATEEGLSVGRAFARGFAEGAKGTASTAVDGLFSKASDTLPGGNKPDLLSWVAAAVVAKGAVTAVKGADWVKTILTGTTLAGKPPVGAPEGSKGLIGLVKTAGKGIANFGAMTAINLGAGNLAGGASMSAGALTAIGLGSVAGGVTGAVSGISGVSDLVKSSKSNDKEEKEVYEESGNKKLMGTGFGATAGAIIGSAFFGLGAVPGAMIGAGIGGAVGSFFGNRGIKNYQNEKAAQEAALLKDEEAAQLQKQAEDLAILQSKFKDERLKNALVDPEMTEQKFEILFQAVMKEDLEARFGKIKLSLREIQSLAEKIVFGESIASVEQFAQAASQAEASFSAYQSSLVEMAKQNWKAGLGIKFDYDDLKAYTSAAEQMIESASVYLENKHYEASSAIEIFFEPEESKDMINAINAMYASFQSSIEDIGTKLNSKIKISLEDGIIDLDEQAEIMSLQSQISEIMNKISKAEQEASMELLKIKYSGAALDSESFSALQQELANYGERFISTYDEAFQKNIGHLKVLHSEGFLEGGEEEYQRLFNKHAEEYNVNVDNMRMGVKNFQLESIAEAYGSELDKVLKDMEGTTAEKLGKMFNKVLSMERDPVKWNKEEVVKTLGIESLGIVTQDNIVNLLANVASTLPTKLDEMDLTAGEEIPCKVGDNIVTNAEKAKDGINEFAKLVTSYVNSVFDDPIKAQVTVEVELNQVLKNALQPFKVDYGVKPASSKDIKPSYTAPESRNAWGGIMTRPHHGLVAEAGPEAIIPLSQNKKERGFKLWQKAGEMLGVKPYADGGLVGMLGNASAQRDAAYATYNEQKLSNVVDIKHYAENRLVGMLNRIIPQEDEAQKAGELLDVKPHADRGLVDVLNGISSQKDEGQKADSANAAVYVPVTIDNITFHVEVSEENGSDNIVEAIKNNIGNITDELAYRLANAMKQSFANMPLEA